MTIYKPKLKSPTSVVMAGSESKRKMLFNPVVFVLFVLFVISTVGFVWSYTNYRTYKNKLTNAGIPVSQEQIAKEQLAILVAKVGKHIVLQADEDPTVATIIDPVALAKDQSFYNNSHVGDKVLIYVKAQKAIIYDEKNDQLVNVGPVYIDKQVSATGDAQNKLTPVSLEVKSGE